MKIIKNIAIFASGNGSNSLKIIEYCNHHPSIRVALIASNNLDAGVLSIAKQHHIPTTIINKKNIIDSNYILSLLESYKIDFIVLAGYMILIPTFLSDAYNHKMVNIHPALLPKYGGKGMYGHHVHEAVFANKEKESGITIHYVNEHYDEGQIIFQKSTSIEHCKSAEEIAKTILRLEHESYAPVIEKLLQ